MSAHEPPPHIPEGSPREGEVWRHRTSGGWYAVIGTGYHEASLHIWVAYKGRGGHLWFRPLGEFIERFKRVLDE